MTIAKIVNKASLICMAIAVLAASGIAQKAASTTPRQEKLLNGLKVLVWSDPVAEKVTVKIRFHSGSSFDPQEREGVMQLVSDSFFPNEAAREFFADELGGNLEVICNYDYVQINASSRPSEFLTMLETIATAVANPTLDKDAATALKAALTTRVAELEKDPAYLADQAIAKRLFGTFPYGRPQMGSIESIQKIDFADLRFARDRLLTADNATVAVSGNVDANLALRAARRYFGAWLKSDKKIPSTFKQPDAPESEIKIINKLTADGPVHLRIAVRGVTRNDAEYPTYEVLARLLENRLKSKPALVGEGTAFVKNEAHILPGQIVFGGSNTKSGVTVAVAPGSSSEKSVSFISHLLATNIDNEEFSSAKSHVSGEWSRSELTEFWLDVDTFKMNPAKGKLQGLDSVTLADVQRVALKIRNQPVATVMYFSPST